MRTDEDWMKLALQQALLCSNDTAPNPRVGCVLVKDGQLLAQGYTQPPGGMHAEISALHQAEQLGVDVRGATAYVTLEPCSHYGRTPPCADALVNAGLARVVAAMADPNPLVAGKGQAKLHQAGIVCEIGLFAAEAHEINIGFFKRMQTGKPWVRLKIAASLDGKTALNNGTSQWITSAEARQDGHAWRARACAILTGIGTVQADDPQLNVRGIAVARQPRRIVVDSRLEISPQAKIIQDGTAIVVFAQRHAEKEAILQALGIELLHLPNAAGKVNLPALLEELGRRQINELHVEAGLKLHASMLREACVDELLLYFAPKILGEGQGMFALPALLAMADLPSQQQFTFHAVEQIGTDLRILARI